MNLLFFTLVLVFFAGVAGSMVGNYIWHKRKHKWVFRIEDIDEETKEIILEPEKEVGKTEFFEDATPDELEELEKPKLWKFLNQFKIRK